MSSPELEQLRRIIRHGVYKIYGSIFYQNPMAALGTTIDLSFLLRPAGVGVDRDFIGPLADRDLLGRLLRGRREPGMDAGIGHKVIRVILFHFELVSGHGDRFSLPLPLTFLRQYPYSDQALEAMINEMRPGPPPQRATSESIETSEVGIEQKVMAILLVAVATFFLMYLLLRGRELQNAVDIADIFGGFGTFLLSLLVSVAALWWFNQRDPFRPKLTIEQDVAIIEGEGSERMLQVFLRLHNVGELMVTIEELRIWACPLSPLPKDVSEKVMKLRAVADAEIDWSGCWGRTIRIPEVRVRAGENQEVLAILRLYDDVDIIRLYTFIPHKSLNLQHKEDRGWTRYSVIDLRKIGGHHVKQ